MYVVSVLPERASTTSSCVFASGRVGVEARSPYPAVTRSIRLRLRDCPAQLKTQVDLSGDLGWMEPEDSFPACAPAEVNGWNGSGLDCDGGDHPGGVMAYFVTTDEHGSRLGEVPGELVGLARRKR
jgi:hypothetical protein